MFATKFLSATIIQCDMDVVGTIRRSEVATLMITACPITFSFEALWNTYISIRMRTVLN